MDTAIPRLPQSEPLRGQVHHVLEELIIHRKLSPGTHLREPELAERLGVSRNPVREALVTLQRDGWVEVRHRQGAFVRTPGPGEAHETFEVRGMLETQAAMLAARQITPAQLQELEEILRKGRAAYEAEDEVGLVEFNAAFHRIVADASGNSVLQELLLHLEKRVKWFFSAVAVARGADSWREHEELSRYLQAHDAEGAARVMRGHTETTHRVYLEGSQVDDVG
ncbi:MAG: GntR family transcriptional regulator [Nitriliruptor sp.]|uniref:GntR family transcriptional regulator n=1 Tax=Nitriliruptor sp. TaxID=2448056 RepID=UPI0034A08C39